MLTCGRFFQGSQASPGYPAAQGTAAVAGASVGDRPGGGLQGRTCHVSVDFV